MARWSGKADDEHHRRSGNLLEGSVRAVEAVHIRAGDSGRNGGSCELPQAQKCTGESGSYRGGGRERGQRWRSGRPGRAPGQAWHGRGG